VLLSQYAGNYTDPLLIQCKCGNQFNRSFQVFSNPKSTQYHCDDCSGKTKWTYEKVKSLAIGSGGAVVSNTFTTVANKMVFRCAACGDTFDQIVKDFIRLNTHCQCTTCKHKLSWIHNGRKVTIEQVAEFVSTTRCKLVSTSINGINDKLDFLCWCGQPYTQQYSVFRTRQIHECQSCTHKRVSGLTQQQIDALNDTPLLTTLHNDQKYNMAKIANTLDVSLQTVCNHFHQHGIRIQDFPKSNGEQDIVNFIKSHTDHIVVTNTRNIISPYELDIYIPSLNIALEYCGIYWHSEARGRDSNYHVRKYNMCAEKNIRLITIFEDEWINHPELIKHTLLSKLQLSDQDIVYARNTTIKSVSLHEKREFLQANHLLGNGRGSIAYGLYNKKDQLVALTEFVNNPKGFLLNRYATSCRVVGGFSKLLSYFKQNHDWNLIYTFADRRWSNGNLYERTGFERSSIIPPDYYYVKNGQRYHKFSFRHKNLAIKLVNYDPTLSERDNCKANGLSRIWDCGKIYYTLNNAAK
jgi:DNA-directed RNA polymerase subunit RPC12/RpoP